MSARKVLVTGSSGFLGSYVMERYEREWGVEVKGLSSTDCDLIDPQWARSVIELFEPDSIVHLAAVCGGIGANMQSPGWYLYANSMMAMNVIETARQCGVKKIVMVGSVCQYPENTPAPFKEEDLWNGYPEPTNAPYGIAKRLGMEMMKAYYQQYGMQGSFLIPANLYGPRDCFDPAKSHVIPAIIKKFGDAMKNGEKKVGLWGSGTATRDFLHARDAADAIVRAEASTPCNVVVKGVNRDDLSISMEYAKQPISGFEVMNLGTGVAVSIFDLAVAIGKHMGFSGELSFDPAMPDGQKIRCIDSTRAKNVLGWEATTLLDDGLRETINWYLDNRSLA